MFQLNRQTFIQILLMAGLLILLEGCTQKLTTSGVLTGNTNNGSSSITGPVASTPTPSPTTIPTSAPTPNPSPSSSATPGTYPSGWLYTKGNKIYTSTGSSGTPWMGRGVNMDDVFLCGYNYTLWMNNPDTALKQVASNLISSWKPNFIRMSLSMDSNPTVVSWSGTYATQMTGVVNSIAANSSVYTLVTLRTDTTMSRCGDEATALPTAATDPTYVAIVDSFAHVPNVMFGLSNEPGCGSVANSVISSAMDHAIKTIRAEEDKLGVPHHIISVQGNGWNTDVSFYLPTGSSPLPVADRENVVYEIHYYTQYDSVSSFDTPSSTVPVIIGEYGGDSESGGMPASFYQDVETRQISNLAWDYEPYSDCGPDLLNVNQSSTVISPTGWGSQVKSYLLNPGQY